MTAALFPCCYPKFLPTFDARFQILCRYKSQMAKGKINLLIPITFLTLFLEPTQFKIKCKCALIIKCSRNIQNTSFDPQLSNIHQCAVSLRSLSVKQRKL